MGVPENEKLQTGFLLQLVYRNRAQASPLVPRAIRAARVGASLRERARPVGMKGAECGDRETVSHDGSDCPVPAIFLVPQTVAVIDASVPSGQTAAPRPDVILDSDIRPQNLTAPAIVITGYIENGHAAFAEIRQRGQGAEAAPWNDRFPFEPEVEEIAIDDKRPGLALEFSQERNERLLDIDWCDSEMRIRYHVAWGVQHPRIVVEGADLHKPIDWISFVSYAHMSVDKPAATTSEVEFRVRYAETDQMQVVYHANYLVWCEIGRTDLIRRLGTSYADIEKQGIALAVTDASLRFHAAARYDDLIRVRTVLSEARSRSVTFEYTIENAETGVRLVTARTSLVAIKGDGKLVALPAHLRQSLEAAIA